LGRKFLEIHICRGAYACCRPTERDIYHEILFEEIDREGGTAAVSSALVSKENQRNSPLQLAFQKWNEEIVNFLVEKILRLDNLHLVKVLLSGENRIL
jgi:hypothetical protein